MVDTSAIQAAAEQQGVNIESLKGSIESFFASAMSSSTPDPTTVQAQWTSLQASMNALATPVATFLASTLLVVDAPWKLSIMTDCKTRINDTFSRLYSEATALVNWVLAKFVFNPSTVVQGEEESDDEYAQRLSDTAVKQSAEFAELRLRAIAELQQQVLEDFDGLMNEVRSFTGWMVPTVPDAAVVAEVVARDKDDAGVN